MRGSPERIAWVVLCTAFAVFCVIVVGIPLGVRWYLRNAEREQKALVESLVGTVVVDLPVGRGPLPISKGQKMVVPEGTTIRVDETSEAVVSCYSHDMTRLLSFMRLFSGSTLRLERMRASRFRWGIRPDTVYLQLAGGRASIGTALAPAHGLDFRVATLHGVSQLDADGRYALEVSNDRTEVAAYGGHAKVQAAGSSVDLGARQRTQIEFDQPPVAPKDVARNLVINGDLRDPLEQGWRVFNEQGADGGSLDGTATIVVEEGRKAVRFYRTGGQGNHCETVLEQIIDKPLPDPATSLVVRATVQVRYQSLPGGGYLSSEFPLMIRVTYRDVYDSEAEWVQGFYYALPAGTTPTNGVQILRDRWYLFESGNLLEQLRIKPFRITRLRVYASGWDYDSLLSDISLIVE